MRSFVGMPAKPSGSVLPTMPPSPARFSCASRSAAASLSTTLPAGAAAASASAERAASAAVAPSLASPAAAGGGASAAAGAGALGINRRLLLSGKCRRQSVFFRICQFILDLLENQFVECLALTQCP